MEILNEGFPNGNQIILDSLTATYIQENDCAENSSDDFQTLIISTRDGGGGKFVNIKTNSWSIDSEEDLLTLIKDFKKKYEITSVS